MRSAFKFGMRSLCAISDQITMAEEKEYLRHSYYKKDVFSEGVY